MGEHLSRHLPMGISFLKKYTTTKKKTILTLIINYP